MIRHLRLFISCLLLVLSINISAADFYWIGSNGQWNNPANWSQQANGIAGTTVPQANDNVYFTQLTDHTQVNINGKVDCRNIQIKSNKLVRFTGSKQAQLSIHGSALFADNLINDFEGQIHFNSSTNQQLQFGLFFPNNSLIFEGGGNWNILGEISSASPIELNNGSLKFSQSDVLAERLILSNTGNNSVEINQSSVYFHNPNPTSSNYSFQNNNGYTNLSGVAAHPFSTKGLKINKLITSFSTDSVRPSCVGAADGKFWVSNIVGGGPYTIQWFRNGNPLPTNNDTAINLDAGSLLLVITDQSDASVVFRNLTLGEPNEIFFIPSVTNETCINDCDGSIILPFVTGGTPPFTFSWSNGATTQNISSLCVGTYTITVTDNNSCTRVESRTVSGPSLILANLSQTNVLCNGNCTGDITVAPTGGTGTYTNYQWSNGMSGAAMTSISSLCAGSYTVTITDSDGCTITESTTITEPSALGLSMAKSDVFCAGDNTGNATATPSGGTPAYTFNWSNGGSTGNITGLVAGRYTVTVTDNNGCTIVDSVDVGEPPPIVITFSNIVNVSCNGGNDGSATATGSGGAGGIAGYLWSTGSSSQTINGLTAGTYTVTVTDGLFCTEVDSVTITEPLLLEVNVDATTDPLCNGDANGTITVSGTGGTPAYTFGWSNGGSGTNLTGLTAGTYTVTVTDNNGCTATTSATLTDPAVLTIAIDSLENVNCNGDNDGFARAAAAGGTTPYTFAWSNGPSTAANPNLTAGLYTVTVTDNNGCTAATTATITEPAVALTASIVGTDATCNGVDDGQAVASGNGGTTPYTFAWSTGSSSNTITALAGGSYTVTVTDANGCTDDETVTINQPPAITIAFINVVNVLCNGDATGQATAVPTGGVPTLTFTWSGGQTTANPTNLSAGVNRLTITDANGCTGVDSVTITEPSLLTATISASTDPTCNGIDDGTATATGNGGTTPYTFAWSSGGSSSLETGLGAGTFTVTITDNNGCTATDNVTLTAPLAVTITLDSTSNVSCNGGNDGFISVTTAGGTLPHTFNWSNGPSTAANPNLTAGTYTVTVTDASGCTNSLSQTITEPTALSVTASGTNLNCNGDNSGTVTAVGAGGTPTYTFNWSNGSSGSNLTGLAANTYTVTITDANGCTSTDDVTITEPAAININFDNVTDVSCNGAGDGSITVSATGGTPTYTFNWSNGGSGTTITGLDGGTFTVTVTDANGCTNTGSTTVNEPSPLVISVDNQTNVSCNGSTDGSATVSATGGTPAYTFNWSGGQSGTTVNSLAAGTHTVTVTDANNCTDVTQITITEPAVLDVTLNATNVQCNGANDGTITANPTGGTPTYTYQWSNGASTQTISNLSPGFYAVTVTDANNCSDIASTIITQPLLPITVTAAGTPASCNGVSDGIIGAFAFGGTAPLTYNWSNGSSGFLVTNVPAGTYTVTVTDNNGCTETASTVVTEPAAIVINVDNQTNVSCNGLSDGSITVSATGGTPAFTFNWSNGGSGTTINGLAAGTYTVTATDANNCQDSLAITITEPAPITINLDSISDASCNGGTDGYLEVSGSGGTIPYSFVWSNGPTTAINANLSAGTYTVTMTDGGGCTNTDSYTINEPTAVVAAITTNSGISCNGASDGSLTASGSGGNPAYTFNWSNGPTTALNDNLPAGTYTVTVTDNNGCTDTETTTLTDPAGYTYTETIVNNPCFGDCLGSIDIVGLSGGTPAYTFTWSNGANSSSISGLCAGSYTLTISDANSCDSIRTFTITEPTQLLASITTNANVSCNGGNDGSVTASATGGTTAYTFNWSNGPSTALNDNLTAGTYTVTVTDNNGCTDTESVTITQPTGYTYIDSVVNNPCFGDCLGAIDIIGLSGGTPAYTFTWSTGATGTSISGLCAGSYTLTISDANSCDSIRTFTITEPTQLVALISTNANVSCNGGNDGSVTASATGGTPTYTFAWSNGPTTALNDNLTAGTYTVTVTDRNGCTDTESVTITQPTGFTYIDSTSNNPCFGDCVGTIDIIGLSGGTPAYTYQWSNGASGPSINGLCAGNYTLTITDANNCDSIRTFTITEPTQLVASITVNSNVSCSGGNDGELLASATGGTPNYTFNWSNGPTTALNSNLTAGTYTVTVTDRNGCTDTESMVVIELSRIDIQLDSIANVSCNGGNDGYLEVSSSGGIAPFTFAWSNGPSTAANPNLTAGRYTVTVSDANGCSADSAFTITGPTILDATININSSVSCSGGNDGELLAIATGGTPAYTFNWSNGPTTALNSNLSAGTYTVTVTDNNGCTDTESIVLSQSGAYTFTDSIIDNVCNGDCLGEIYIQNVSGGTSPYTFNWSNGGTTATLTGLCAGTYTLTLTDANSCDSITIYTISEPTAITATTSSTNSNCTVCDGTATVNPSGGTPGPLGYSFMWMDNSFTPIGQTSQTATSLCAGVYNVQVTDANNCVDTFSVSVSDNNAPTATVVPTPASCFGVCDGNATVTASCGVCSSITWLDNAGAPIGQTGTSATGLCAGSYQVEVVDNGCTTLVPFNITEPTQVLVNLTTINQSCTPFAVCDGLAYVTPSGGTSPYTFAWSTGSVSDTARSLCPGAYSVTVTDANGCTADSSFTIVQASNTDPNPDSVDVSCFGVCDGQASVNPTGGVTPYTFNWSGGQSTSSIQNLCAGSYTVTITDALGCDTTVTINVDEPTQISPGVSTIDQTCNGPCDGEASANPTGGVSPYTYLWSTGSSSQTITGLCAGTYTVTVTDASGCTAVESGNVGNGSTIVANENVTDASCFGRCDGAITLNPTGGTPTYTFSWSNGSTNQNLSGLCAGTYTVTIADASGCSTILSATVNEPTDLTVSFTKTDESCGTPGQATAIPAGGTPPYTYQWSNGPTTDNNPNISAGTYTVTVTDNNNCTEVDNVTILSNGALSITNGAINNVTCQGDMDGSITVIPSGGNAPYTFVWSSGGSTSGTNSNLSGGTYTVTVTDASGCSGASTNTITEPTAIVANESSTDANCSLCDGTASVSPSGGNGGFNVTWLDNNKAPIGQTGLNASNLCSGLYYAAIVDNNGCVDTASVTINDIGGPTASISSVNNETCAGSCNGTITVNAPCVIPPFNTCTIEWFDGAGTNLGINTLTITNLCAGRYTAIITDNNNCQTILDTVITTNSNISAGFTVFPDDCFSVCDGRIVSNPTGGATPYQFQWSNGAVNVNEIPGLCVGTYTITITDANGCTLVDSATVTKDPKADPNATIVDETCIGSCDGSITLNPIGGTPPFTYSWSSGQTNPGISNLCAGTYTLTFTDASQCDTVITYNINSSGTISPNETSTDLSCGGTCDGTASVSPTGGVTPYTFAWSTGSTNSSINNLCAGTYTVTITDASACSATASVTVNDASPILANETISNLNCNGVCDGRIDLTPSGGVGTYTYLWAPAPPLGQGTPNARGLCAGNISVTITDGAGCDSTFNFTITEPPAIVSNPSFADAGCFGVCDGRAQVAPTGGSAPYTYQWAPNGETTDIIDNLCAGNYTVTITDANGCSTTEAFTIGQSSSITATTSSTNATCGICDGTVSVNASGGTGSLTYDWLDNTLSPIGQTTPTATGLCAGAYFVDVTDANGCTERFNANVSDIGGEALTAASGFVSCFGSCDGRLDVFFTCSDPACTVEWFDAATGASIAQGVTSVSNLCAGNYFVEVTNASGCISIENLSIGTPSEIVATATQIDANCNNSCDGSISLTTSGGTGVYTYVWSPAPGSGQGTANVSGLCAGNYSVIISDDSGCSTSQSYTIAAPAAITAAFAGSDANCGLSDGSITAVVSGGTVAIDYQYQWFDPSNVLLVGETNPTITNIPAGAYTLRVRDDNACEEFFTFSIGNLNGGASISLDSVRSVSCFGDNNGSISITANGGIPPYTYSWLPGGQTSEDIAGLGAGTYTVQVTDNSGCVTVATYGVTEPTELQASFSNTDASCGACNGQSSISVSGGTGSYTYLWSNGSTADSADNLCSGIYNVEVTDSLGCKKTFDITINNDNGPGNSIISLTQPSCGNSCDGAASVTPVGGTAPYTYQWLHNGATTNSLNNLCAGTYFIRIADANNCSRTEQVDIVNPAALSISSFVTPTSCGVIPCDGAIRLTVNGGATPYTYAWAPVALPDSNYVDGLCSGTYTVTVTDANGCTTAEIINVSNTGTPFTPNPTVTDESCFGVCDGTLTANVPLDPNLVYQWQNDQGVAIVPAGQDVTGACPGKYILEVTNIIGNCVTYTSVDVQAADSIIVNLNTVKQITCGGDCDAEVNVSTLGGNLLFTYSWSDPNNQNASPAIGLCSGTYTVTATDANGCSATSTTVISEPPVLSFTSITKTDLNCSSDCDATANVTINGGVSPFTYTWSGGQNISNPNTLCFGKNLITVIDANGCSITDSVFIAAADTVVANAGANLTICENDSIRLNGQVVGSGITSFEWRALPGPTFFSSRLDTTFSRPVGTYQFVLFATDGSCEDQDTITITVNPNPPIDAGPNRRIFKDQVAQLGVFGALNRYTYVWTPSTGLNNANIPDPISDPDETITYQLRVTDSTGCFTIDSLTVEYLPNITFPTGISPNGDGMNDTWTLEFINEFPNARIQVFSRWGELLFESVGYATPWDGTYDGKPLPIGTYYYIIDLKEDGIDPITGPITIMK